VLQPGYPDFGFAVQTGVIEADAVIAADGIHSVLQDYAVERTETVFSGTVAYRGLVSAPRVPDWPQSLVV
jgi:salicylate hydroxylase